MVIIAMPLANNMEAIWAVALLWVSSILDDQRESVWSLFYGSSCRKRPWVKFVAGIAL